MDIFEILGPVMVGPSSSHTAGAARIGSMARTLLGSTPVKAAIHLHGSFADTGLGHGTDRALVAGLLGMKPDDLRIPYAFEEAKKAGLSYTIDVVELRDAHPNTALIEVWGTEDKHLEMQASSLGGGRIMVDKLDGQREFHRRLQHAGDSQSGLLFLRGRRDHHFEPVPHQHRQHEHVAAQAGRRRADDH